MIDGAGDSPPVARPKSKPQPPREPEADECCRSGCEPCVFDRYADACARYEEELAAWERSNAADPG